MEILSQRDLRWASKKLGLSNLTVGNKGCTTTCLAMAASYFGETISPLQIASNVNNYTKEGLIIWGNLNFKKMKFVSRERLWPSQNLLKECLKDPNRVILLEVNDGAHWVLATGFNWFGRLMCADPWMADRCDLLKRYKNITGAAIFARK